MTVFATWWKAALPLLLLTGCQASPEATAPPPARVLAAGPAERGSTPASAPTGLTPLPTAQQVVTAQPVGRADPFLPVTAADGPAAAASAPPPVPDGFRFSGVIRSRGQAQALVQFGPESGLLRTGDVGGRTTKLLPPGWAVGRIDVARGVLVLRASGRAIALSLSDQG